MDEPGWLGSGVRTLQIHHARQPWPMRTGSQFRGVKGIGIDGGEHLARLDHLFVPRGGRVNLRAQQMVPGAAPDGTGESPISSSSTSARSFSPSRTSDAASSPVPMACCGRLRCACLRRGDGFGDSSQGQIGFSEARMRVHLVLGDVQRLHSFVERLIVLPPHTRWPIRMPRHRTLNGSCSTARRISAVDSSKRPKTLRYKAA